MRRLSLSFLFSMSIPPSLQLLVPITLPHLPEMLRGLMRIQKIAAKAGLRMLGPTLPNFLAFYLHQMASCSSSLGVRHEVPLPIKLDF